MDKSIRKLRLKFWLLLTGSFSLILLGVLFFVYLTTAHEMEQELSNWLASPEVMDEFRAGNFLGQNVFLVEFESFDSVEVLDSMFDMEAADYKELIGLALNQDIVEKSRWQQFLASVEPGQIRWRGQSWSYTFMDQFNPLELGDNLGNSMIYLDVEGSIYWETNSVMETFILDRETLENLMNTTRYLIFIDVTYLIYELQDLLGNLSNIGALVFLVVAGISFLLAHLLVRPIALIFNQQKQFIADASHELKTPLTILKSNYGVLMANRGETVESQLEWLEYIKFGFERMTDLTEDLLTLAQLDEDKTLQKSEVDFTELVMASIAGFKPRLGSTALKIDIEPNLVVHQDGSKLAQVVMILLDNAVKYVDEGGQINVLAKRRHKYVNFTVENTGPGIPPHKISRIFERFYQVDDARNSESDSYGLGLAIAKGIVTRMKGKITASSVPNEKTTFTISIKIGRK